MLKRRGKLLSKRPRPRKRVANWRKPRTPPEIRAMIERMKEEFAGHLVPLEELDRSAKEDLGDQSLSELFIKMKGP